MDPVSRDLVARRTAVRILTPAGVPPYTQGRIPGTCIHASFAVLHPSIRAWVSLEFRKALDSVAHEFVDVKCQGVVRCLLSGAQVFACTDEGLVSPVVSSTSSSSSIHPLSCI